MQIRRKNEKTALNCKTTYTGWVVLAAVCECVRGSQHQAVKTTNRTSSAARVPFMFYMLLNCEYRELDVVQWLVTCISWYSNVCARVALPHIQILRISAYVSFFILSNSNNIMWACLNACVYSSSVCRNERKSQNGFFRDVILHIKQYERLSTIELVACAKLVYFLHSTWSWTDATWLGHISFCFSLSISIFRTKCIYCLFYYVGVCCFFFIFFVLIKEIRTRIKFE